MDIAVSQALDLACRWQKNETRINGIVSTDSQELQITFTNARVMVYNDGIVIRSEGCELALTLLPEMTIKYGDRVLEIRHSGYRCVLYEPKD